MDFAALRRHVAETAAAWKERPPIVARAVDLAPSGFGLVLKAPAGWECLQIHLNPDQQGFRISPAWDEAPGESALTRAMARHLKDARIERIELFEASPESANDRIVRWRFLVRDPFFGTVKRFSLIGEFTGRIANLLLCDADGAVIEQARATGNNRPREAYRPPATSPADQVNPSTASNELLGEILSAPQQTWPDRLRCFSPLAAKELAFRRNASPDRNPVSLLLDLAVEASAVDGPVRVYLQARRMPVVSAFEARHLEALGAEVRDTATVNAALELVERELLQPRRLEALREQAVAAFERDLRTKERLLETQRALQAEYADAESWRRSGDLLLTYGGDILPRASEAHLTDWETGQEVTIPLDPSRTPAQNAQKCFHRYKKALRGREETARRIRELGADIAWIREQIWLCGQAETAADLVALPTARPRKGRHARAGGRGESDRARAAAKLIRPLIEIDGCRFYVGRNGRQNDLITFQIGRRGDIWFHANDVPGSHVVARRPGGTPDSEDLVRGAALAAWFSFARGSSKVPVDYADIAFVKRIPGGGAGRVNYTNQKTLFVDPASARQLLEPPEA
ncbi:MAG TPA: NFACT family protein [Candidatus Ozemobacteraceae bacterium]|nr:NFACT family protein [Candidatus Ozemobacteraceae bacterium]